jgi:hypothetical protein
MPQLKMTVFKSLVKHYTGAVKENLLLFFEDIKDLKNSKREEKWLDKR